MIELGVLERLDHRIHEMPLALPLVGVCAQHGREFLDASEQVFTGDDVCHRPPPHGCGVPLQGARV